jgi:thioredoxin 1
MAGEFDGKVEFVEVDVDKSGDVATEYGIGPLPCLVLVKDGEEVGRVIGANEPKIREMIEEAL